MTNNKAGLIIETLEAADNNGITHKSSAKIKKMSSCTVTTVVIDSDEDAKTFEREKGTYITIDMNEMCKITDTDFEDIISVISKMLCSLMKKSVTDRVLIVGIGNRSITADSLGPKCVDRIIVTRGLENVQPELISEGGFSSVSAISSNVFGVTGVESAEMIEGISSVIKPALIIVIDALATVEVSRLCKTIQISNTSLVPGGGVNNSRQKISKNRLDIPLISIGMPTVMDIKTIFKNIGVDDKQISKYFDDFDTTLVTMPINIDTSTDTAAKLISFSINKALHYGMTTEEILKFLY